MLKRLSYTISALFVLAALAPACSDPPPEPGGDGDGDGDASGDGDGDGDTTGDGDMTGDGDGDTSGDGDGDGDSTVLPEELPFGHPSDSATYPEHEGFTLWLVEEFEEPLDLDSDPIWTWSDGGLGEGQVRFVREGIKFEGGKMILEARTDDGTYSSQTCSHAEVGDVATKARTSGEMRTRHNMFRYGRYEVRMKAPSPNPSDPTVNGNYIATLFTFRTPKTLYWREIDIEVTGDTENVVTTNVIYGDNQAQWSEGIADADAAVMEGVNSRTDFHDYAFEWLPTGITWYVDGEVIRTYGTNEKRPVPELSAKIMMNLWIFNDSAGFGGPEIENNQYPMHSEYEWFRFYKWNGDNSYPCAAMDESCLKAGDKGSSSNNPCDGIADSGCPSTTCN